MDAIKAGLVLLSAVLGSGGAFGLWKLFSVDFLRPYREDQTQLRSRLDDAEAKAQQAEQRADQAIESTRRCEEREAHMRLQLIAHGIDVGDPPA